MINSLIADAQKNQSIVDANSLIEETPTETSPTEETTQNKKIQNFDESSFIKWFSELNKNSGSVAGGKGANLSEIYNLKIPVPPGFVVTAQAYDYFLEKAEIKEKISELLDRIDYEDTKQLDEITKQIRAFIEDSTLPPELENEIIEAYESLDVTGTNKNDKDFALNILKAGAEPTFVAVRSSATAEDLAGASFAGQQDTYLNIKGNTSVLTHVKKCFASLFTSRATYYRNKKGFKHAETSLAVIVQKMVDSEKSGVIFSKDPSYKNNNIIMEAVWGLGEGIVSGKITPDRYIISEDLEIKEKEIANKRIALTRDSGGEKTIVKLNPEIANAQVLKNHEIRELSEFALQLEKHYSKPQDMEFAIEGEEIYIVQTRPITTIENRVEEDKREEIKGEPILKGLAASPGIASGKIKIIEEIEDLDKIKSGDILVTRMTNPDMVVTMQKAAAIVTDEGGLTAHAAIVSREMGTPCIVGTQEATTLLKENEIITVNGFTGKIYRGKTAETVKKEVLPVIAQTKTEIKVIVDLPSFAERAAKTELTKVGLTRIEGIIAESGKHPKYFLDQNKIDEYEEIIFNGIEGIAKYFEEIWVRTSDIRTDEFKNLEGAPTEDEANPMLGLHGIRYSLKYPEVLKAELKAMHRIALQRKTIGILMPQLISVEELKEVKKILQELNINNLKLGVMIETPASVQIIKDLCKEGIKFISFGTNDLTQYLLAVDRGNENVQHLFNEMDPAVLYQLSFVIRTCKRAGVETSICGQAGSKKEMVKYLVEQGIDSISVNADAAKEISDYVKELETQRGESPRQYQAEKENENKEKGKDNFTNHENSQKNQNQSTPIEKELSQQPEQKELITEKIEEEIIQEPNPEKTSTPNFIENIEEGIKEIGEKTAELIEEFKEEIDPSKEEEMYHQTFKEEPKNFTEEELPQINGTENLKPISEEKNSEIGKDNEIESEEKLDIF